MNSGQLDGLLLLAALASIRLAQDLTVEQLELLAAFFTVLGDNLALLVLRTGEDESGKRPDIL